MDVRNEIAIKDGSKMSHCIVISYTEIDHKRWNNCVCRRGRGGVERMIWVSNILDLSFQCAVRMEVSTRQTAVVMESSGEMYRLVIYIFLRNISILKIV